MIDLEAVKPRSRVVRKLVFALIAMSVLGIASLQNAGYALLIWGWGPSGEEKNGMVQLNCTYFTGTEKVINHIARVVTDADRPSHCPIVKRLPKLNPSLDHVLTR